MNMRYLHAGGVPGLGVLRDGVVRVKRAESRDRWREFPSRRLWQISRKASRSMVMVSVRGSAARGAAG